MNASESNPNTEDSASTVPEDYLAGEDSGSGLAAVAPALDSQDTEMEMICRVVAGENDLFHELLLPYERILFLAAVSIVDSDHDAEQIVQEAVFRAFKDISHFRGEVPFSTWLIQHAVKEGTLFLKRHRRAAMELLDAESKSDQEA